MSSERVGAWRVSLCEPAGADRGTWFATITLTIPDGRDIVRGLASDALHTKGRGRWRRDNVWRLTEAAIDLLADAIVRAMDKSRLAVFRDQDRYFIPPADADAWAELERRGIVTLHDDGDGDTYAERVSADRSAAGE